MALSIFLPLVTWIRHIKAGGGRILLQGYSVLACFHFGMFITLKWSLWANWHKLKFVYLIIVQNIAYSTSFLILKLITYVCTAWIYQCIATPSAQRVCQLFPEKTSSGTSILPSLISIGRFNQKIIAGCFSARFKFLYFPLPSINFRTKQTY